MTDKLLDLYFEIVDARPERQKSLKNLWKSYTGCEYPRIKNSKWKEGDFLKYYKPETKEKNTMNGLDDLINNKMQETRLISDVLYTKTYTDIPDKNRKKKNNF